MSNNREMPERLPHWLAEGIPLASNDTGAGNLVRSGLGWEIKKREIRLNGFEQLQPLYFLSNDIDRIVYGYCSKNYHEYQNAEAFCWCEQLVNSGKWTWDMSGVFKRGEICWVTLRCENTEISPCDCFKQMLFICWSHNAKQSNFVVPISVRIMNMNTFPALRRNNEYSAAAHRGSVYDHMDKIRSLHKQTSEYFQQKKRLLQKMQQIPMIDREIEIFADELYPNRGNRDKLSSKSWIILKIAETGAIGLEKSPLKNTLYGVFMAATEANEHYFNNSCMERGFNIFFGAGSKENNRICMHTLKFMQSRLEGRKELAMEKNAFLLPREASVI